MSSAGANTTNKKLITCASVTSQAFLKHPLLLHETSAGTHGKSFHEAVSELVWISSTICFWPLAVLCLVRLLVIS